MITSATIKPVRSIVYPESDGLPMADNSRQFQWIFVIAGNVGAKFRDREDVLVLGNQFWYPVEGEPEIRLAPDVYVVFGRPKGHRSSYKQWEEGGIPLTVVFEVLSPSNTYAEMVDKLSFYDDYGVEEYYVYDPDSNHLLGYRRTGSVLTRIRPINGFVSPRLGIRFDLSGPELVIRYPDGRPFLTFEELDAERQRNQERAEQAERHSQKVEHQVQRLAELTRKVLRQEATAAELAELDRLLQSAPTS